MPEVRIAAEPRTEFGKGAARRAPRGPGSRRCSTATAPTRGTSACPATSSLLALRTANVLLLLDGLDGGSELALPKAVQRDPIRGSIEHVDLILVRRGEKVTVDVPVQVTGEVAPDGMLDQQLIPISVEAEATNIPSGVEVDVEGMEIGTAVHAGDLQLPAGTTLAVDPEALVVHVIAAPTAEQIEADLVEPAEAEGAEAPPSPDAPDAPAAEDSGSEGEVSGWRAGPAGRGLAPG